MFKLIPLVLFINLLLPNFFSRIEFGRCPHNPSNLTSLDLNRFMDKWYEVATSDNTDALFRCTTMNFTQLDNKGFTLTIDAKRLDGKTITSVGKAQQKRNQLEFEISFTDSYFSDLFRGDFEIIDTDYDKYAIIYTCGDFATFKYENVWILLRSLTDYKEQIRNFTNFIDKRLDIEEDDFHIIQHGNAYCDYTYINNSISTGNATYPNSTSS